MKALFDALRLRFLANPTLKLKGRELVQGLNEEQKKNVVRPYTECNFKLLTNFNTFDSDVETWGVTFLYHAKDLRVNSAQDWQEALRSAFKDGNLVSPSFSCCGARLQEATGPSNREGVYEASARFEFTIQRRVRNPVRVGV